MQARTRFTQLSKIFQPLRPVRNVQGFNHGAQVPLKDRWQGVQREAYAMVCDPTLREIVGSNLGASVA